METIQRRKELELMLRTHHTNTVIGLSVQEVFPSLPNFSKVLVTKKRKPDFNHLLLREIRPFQMMKVSASKHLNNHNNDVILCDILLNTLKKIKLSN